MMKYLILSVMRNRILFEDYGTSLGEQVQYSIYVFHISVTKHAYQTIECVHVTVWFESDSN